MHHSDHEDHDGHVEEHSLSSLKDDMASRRMSSHIPAPLRKKKNEDQYKKFITPTGNPVAYLQKHMRSKSLSDLNEEKKEEQQHRAEINTRYEEMDTLKVLLKEEEDTWTSKLQSWKTRRRSVTEDVRKRKEQRANLEKEVEIKTGRRKSKTYKEIVEDKMRREEELAQLNDEYEFVGPRSLTSGTGLTSPEPVSSAITRYSFDANLTTESRVKDTSASFPRQTATRNSFDANLTTVSRVKDTAASFPRQIATRNSFDANLTTVSRVKDTAASFPRQTTTRNSFDANLTTVSRVKDTAASFPRQNDVNISKETELDVFFKYSRANPTPNENPVQYKYTTKVTAVINKPPDDAESRSQLATSSITLSLANSQSDPPKPVYGKASALNVTKSEESQIRNSPIVKNYSTEKTSAPQERPQSSNVPKVLLRSKNPTAQRERPKSAHDLPTGSSTLPRSYRDHSTPQPFTSGASNFTQYRKTAFASRRNMWENMSVSGIQTLSSPPGKGIQPIHTRNASDEILSSRPLHHEPAHHAAQNVSKSTKVLEPSTGPNVSQHSNMFERQQAKNAPSSQEYSKGSYPPKVPLISRVHVPVRQQTVPAQTQPVLISRARVPVRQQTVPAQTQPVSESGLTATLSSSGLSMTSPRTDKATLHVTSPEKFEALFDDMKICINQRPRSEKGFGFTVRGGDDRKPVIVDTVSPGGAADICHLCVSDEILAINEIQLTDSKTQEDIVYLIVSSLITGHLSLNIRRYGKSKKTSPLRLSGTKVVMTPGGFVQVRSDKPVQLASQTKAQSSSMFQKEISTPKDGNNNEEVFEDGEDDYFPPPPSHEELNVIGNTRCDTQRQSPLSNLVEAASRNFQDGSNKTFEKENTEDSFSSTAFSEVHSGKHDEDEDDDDNDELRQEVIEAQKALDFERFYQPDREYEKQQLRQKFQEEQRKLEEEDAQREEIRRKIQEEARLEDIKVEEELRRIQSRKLKQQQERRKEMESLQKDNKTSTHTLPNRLGIRTNGYGESGGTTHWMIEEAERRRVAEQEGKKRINAFEQGRKSEPHTGSALPDHVIQHLTQRASKPSGPRPYVRNTVEYEMNSKTSHH